MLIIEIMLINIQIYNHVYQCPRFSHYIYTYMYGIHVHLSCKPLWGTLWLGFSHVNCPREQWVAKLHQVWVACQRQYHIIFVKVPEELLKMISFFSQPLLSAHKNSSSKQRNEWQRIFIPRVSCCGLFIMFQLLVCVGFFSEFDLIWQKPVKM